MYSRRKYFLRKTASEKTAARNMLTHSLYANHSASYQAMVVEMQKQRELQAKAAQHGHLKQPPSCLFYLSIRAHSMHLGITLLYSFYQCLSSLLFPISSAILFDMWLSRYYQLHVFVHGRPVCLAIPMPAIHKQN